MTDRERALVERLWDASTATWFGGEGTPWNSPGELRMLLDEAAEALAVSVALVKQQQDALNGLVAAVEAENRTSLVPMKTRPMSINVRRSLSDAREALAAGGVPGGEPA